MISLKKNHLLFLGISTGLFISSVLLFFFATVFSYSRETNIFASLFLVIALLIFYCYETIWRVNAPKPSKFFNNQKLQTIVLIVAPLLCSFTLIQGDTRSWFLVIISAILTWVIIK
jgi:hypothetical protein